MPKNYNELKKRGLKGTVAIGIVVATLLLMHSCFSDKEIEEKEKLTNIGDKKIEKMEELTSIDEKEKLVSSDEDINSSIKGGVVKVNDSDLESLITEGNSFKENKLKGKTALKTQNEKIEDTQIFKVKKKSKNKNEVIGIIFEDNISDVNESDRRLIKEEKKVKEKEHSLLIFGSLGFEKINHSSSKDIGSTDPIIPEVIIWENGKDIQGEKYTLTKDLEIINGVDGLKTIGGTITNQATINSSTSIKSTDGNFGMRVEDHADGRKGIGINEGTIIGSIMGMGSINGGDVINRGTISVSGHNGIYIEGEKSSGLNDITGIISNSGNNGIHITGKGLGINNGVISNLGDNGIKIEHGGKGVNNGTISNEGFNGMFIYGDGSKGINNGTITNNNSRGIYISGAGSIGINEVSGVISNDGSNGMKIEYGGMGVNKGIINNNSSNGVYIVETGSIGINEVGGIVSNSGPYGMKIEYGGRGVNKGTISNEGRTGIYVRGAGATGLNDLTGIISNNNSIGMYVKDAGNIVNKGIISNKGDLGMMSLSFSAESVALNDTEGIIQNEGVKGMAAESGGQLINKGIISNGGNSGMYVTGKGSVGINDADGVISNDGNSGMYVKDSGSIVNKGTISNKGNLGMDIRAKYPTSESMIVKNEAGAVISNSGDYGIFGQGNNNLTVINSGTIENEKNYGMTLYGDDQDRMINKGTVKNKGDIGMFLLGNSTITNEGTISNDGDSGMKITAVGGKIGTGINDSDGVIENKGRYGMYIESLGANGINKGIVSNHSDYGLYVDGNGAIATNDGIIKNLGDYGVWTGGYSTAINNGTIYNDGNYRMEALSKSTAINNGILYDGFDEYIVMRGNDASTLINTGHINTMYSNSIAMEETGGGAVINKGTININKNGKGIYINGGGTATNDIGGKINLNGDYGVGIYADSSETKIENKGTINIRGNHGTGMFIAGGGLAINSDTGIINLDGSHGIGIHASGSGTRVENKGTINLSGNPQANGTDDKYNTSIKLDHGASLVNSGVFKSDGSINFDDMGDGKFIMSDGGTLKAGGAIKGDIYASGALAMGGYDDVYSTYKMLETNELDGNIISNSAMFDAHFTDNADDNGFYDVVLDRKDFNIIVSNEEIGKILEDNYEDNGNELKEDYYDALKLVSTEKGLDKAVEDSYGMSYYPTLAKQTFEIVNDSNQVIVDNVINNERVRRVGETIAIAGVNATRLENDSHDNASGYDTDLYSVYLGAEKQVNKNLRIGGIITIGKGDTDFNDVGGSREDYYYQGNVYFTYENEDRLKFTSMIFGGMTDTSLERTLAFGSLYETMKDDINNYYIGLNNELSKKYYFGQNYIKPKFELNFTYMMQDDISESGDQGLEIDSENSTSLETGLGIALGRNFYFESGSKINLEGSVTGYAELGDPYKNLDSTFNTLSTDKVKIDGYNNDDFYGDIMIGGSYETKDSLKLYTKVGYRIGNDSDGPIGNIGFNYLF